MKLLILFGSLVLVGFSFAEESSRSQGFRYCESWSYDFETHNYQCRFLSSWARFVETDDLKSEIARLEDRIKKLEDQLVAMTTGTALEKYSNCQCR